MPNGPLDDRSIVRLPDDHRNDDGNLECPECGCLDFLRIGKRQHCQACDWSFVDLGLYRGPQCDQCQGSLEVRNTRPWKNGQRNRCYFCPRCRLTKETVETERD